MRYDELGRNISYRGEIIFTLSTPTSLYRAVNLYRNAVLLGYEHFFVLMTEEKGCVALRQIDAGVRCVHTSYLLNHHALAAWAASTMHRLWMLRWKLVSELASRGYSVLAMDSDIALRADIYSELKTPPWSNYSLISHPEGGVPGLNCGFIYASGVRPGRGAHWLLNEVSRRWERWLAVARPPVNDRGAPGDSLWEQLLFNDAAASSFSGRQIFKSQMNSFLRGPVFDAWHTGGWRGGMDESFVYWNHTKIGAYHALQPCAHCDGGARQRGSPGGYGGIPYHSLSVPIDEEAPWVGEEGPAASGPGGTPWVPLGPGVAAQPDADTIAVAPAWMVAQAHLHANTGIFGAEIPQVVAIHLISSPAKQLMLREMRAWYFAPGRWSEDSKAIDTTTTTRLVALAPQALDELTAGSQQDARRAAHKLIVAAALSGRIPVLPLLPCRSPWLTTTRDRQYYYNDPAGALFPAAPRDREAVLMSGPADAPRCHLLLLEGCSAAAALATIDLERWLEAHPELTPATGDGIDLAPTDLAGDVAARTAAVRSLLDARSQDTIVYIHGTRAVPLLTTLDAPAAPPPQPPRPPQVSGARVQAASGEAPITVAAGDTTLLSAVERRALQLLDERCRLAQGW